MTSKECGTRLVKGNVMYGIKYALSAMIPAFLDVLFYSSR